MNQNPWEAWIGRSQSTRDTASIAPVQRLAATLDRSFEAFCPQQLVPPLAHWLYFLPTEPQSDLGHDGHARKGLSSGLLPPVELPRRMWAGSQIEFHRDIALGAAIERTSTITRIETKQGRSGTLVFVKVRHDITSDGALAITDCHDIVYREAVAPTPPGAASMAPAAPSEAHFSRRITPDAVLLFRYSALTFNGHRIHYDYPYVTEVEGYPGLIVHGPLIATLLLDELRKQMPHRRIGRYEFKAINPLFHHQAFEIFGRVDGSIATLWACSAAGALAMQASAHLQT